MRLPFWMHVVIWLLFLLIVLAPTIWLAVDGLRAAELRLAWPTLLSTDQWRLLTRSLTLAASAAGVALVLGVPYALLCERTDLPGVPLWRVLGVLPLLIPPFIHAMAWLRLGSPTDSDPWLAQAIGDLLPPVTSTAGAAFVLGLAYLPFVILLAVAGLRGLDHRLEEAGLLRTGPMRVWLGITLPLVRPHLMAGGLFVFVFALVEFAVPDILRVQVYPVEIFIQFSALFDEAAAVALALPLLLITIAAVLAIGWTLRGRAFVSIAGGLGQLRLVQLRHWRPVALVFCGLVILFSVVLPLLHLVLAAGPLVNYAQALSTSWDDIFASVGLSASAAILTLGLALALALSLRGLRGSLRTGLDLLSQVPFAVPPVLLGIGLIKVWNHPQTAWVYGSAAVLVLAYIAHFAPFAVRILHAAVGQIDPSQIDAGRLRAGRLRVLVYLMMPLLRNGLLAAAFICFVLSLGELGVTLLVTPPGLSPIPIDIYNYMHYGSHARVAALCLTLIAIQLAVAALLYQLRARAD